MPRIKKDTRPLYVRLNEFQLERAPLVVITVSAMLTVGVFASFAQFNIRNYIVAVMISVLYLIQARTSDEKKDYEHDNVYHPNRPVQRGVVSLAELAVINKLSIAMQLLLYASFGDARILAFGVLSQTYAFLTKKEFFVREWIRQHFFTYYFLHYIQLVLLNLAVLNIIKPGDAGYWQLITFVMLNIIIVEVGRKMFAKEDDTIDDTFSAQLGHKGSALTFTSTGLAICGFVYYFVASNGQNYLAMILPLTVQAALSISAYRYAISPNRKHADQVKYSGLLMSLASSIAVIIGV